MKQSLASVMTCISVALSAGGFGLALLVANQPLAARIALLLVWVGVSFIAAMLLIGRVQRQISALAHIIHIFPQPPGSDIPPVAHPFSTLNEALDSARTRTARELTLIEEERAKLAAVLDSMQDWVVAVDAAGRIQWANAPMRKAMHGVVRPGQALIHVIRDPDVLLCFRVAVDDHIVCERRSTSFIPGRIFDIITSPIPGGGAVAVLHDSTRIEQVERTQREFIANVSHELRTPLTSISGYVETLLDHETSLSNHGREFLDTILKNATRMTRLTEDLLVLARVESGEQRISPHPVSAQKLVTDAIASVRGLVHEAGASITSGKLTSISVSADSDAIVQVLSNLIENATKYGRSQSGAPARVEVSAIQKDDFVQFRIRDWGKGIASEHLERIFERFYRVDKARSRETGGTGLGLAIARHIVEEHGGSVWAESSLGSGSTFIFILPLAS